MPFDKKTYDKQYEKDHFKRLSLVLPVEEYDFLKQHLALFGGGSVNGFIRQAIIEKIEHDENAPGE